MKKGPCLNEAGAFALFEFLSAFVKRRVERVEVFAVKVILRDAEGIGEAVNMK